MSVAIESTAWQIGFLSILPGVQTHARIAFRAFPARRRGEAIAEAVASACVSYQRLAARGRLQAARPSTIADFAVKFVHNGRHVGSSQDAAKDVMSPVAQRRHGVQVVSYDAPRRVRGKGGFDGWKQMAVEDRRVSIPDLVAFRVDFGEWLQTLTRRDCKIIAALAGGERSSEVADGFGLSAGRISQLRRQYEHLWRVFQGEQTYAA